MSEMDEDNGTKYPTWKWVVVIACTIIGFLALQGVNSVNARLDGKVDLDKYEADKKTGEANRRVRDLEITIIKNDISEIKEMVLCIYDSKLPPELRRRKGRQ